MSRASDEHILPLANHDAADWPAPGQPLPEPHRRGLLSRLILEFWHSLPAWPGYLNQTRTLMISVLVLLAGGVILFATGKAVFEDVVVIDPISVSIDLEARGYTGAAITRRIFDEIKNISQVASTAKQKADLSQGNRSDTLSKVELPASGLSVATIVAILRDVLGSAETRIGGEVTVGRPTGVDVGPAQISLLIRIDHQHVRHVRHLGKGDLDQQIKLAAIEVMKHVDPYVLASYFYANESWDEMNVLINRILAKQDGGDHKWALILRGNYFHRQGQRERALTYYELAISLDGKFATALTNKGLMLAERGDHAGALEMYKVAATADSKSYFALNNWGALLSDAGDHAGAMAKFKRAIEVEPKPVMARKNLAAILVEMRDYEAAALEYLRTLELNPKDKYALMGWGDVLYRLNLRNDAENKFERALEIEERSELALTRWGDALSGIGDRDAAREHYVRAITKNPEYVAAYVGLGRIQLAEFDTDGSLATCRHAMKFASSYASTHGFCGDVLRLRGSHKEAIEHFTRAVSLAPGNWRALVSLGSSFYAGRDFSRGGEYFAKAVNIRPHDAVLLNTWGEALYDARDFHGAAEKFEKATRIDPGYTGAYENWAEALRALGDRKGATRCYTTMFAVVGLGATAPSHDLGLPQSP